MLAVKLVVHGLVEFIQNFSKKSYDTPQVSDQKNTRRETTEAFQARHGFKEVKGT